MFERLVFAVYLVGVVIRYGLRHFAVACLVAGANQGCFMYMQAYAGIFPTVPSEPRNVSQLTTTP